MTGIILAGGKNTRMQGEDKAFLELEGRTIISGLIDKLRSLTDEIIVVTNSPEKYDGLGVRLVKDQMPGKGPLMGIYCGLKASSSRYNFIVACDMPFVHLGLIRYMYKNLKGYDVVIPKVNNRYEPLFCIYSKMCLKYIKQQLDKKIFKIRKFFFKVKVREITKREIVKFANPEELFANINTKEDLKRLNG